MSNARELIENAYFLAGVVAPDFQRSTGAQITRGLSLLNRILSRQRINSGLIPYYKKENFNLAIGDSEYFIENLIAPETFVFFISNVRFGTWQVGRDIFFGASRVEGVRSLPFQWHFELEKGGCRIFLYFVPDAEYSIEIWGKFGFENVTLDTDLDEVYDDFYQDYLTYFLAQYICHQNQLSVPPDVLDNLKSLKKEIRAAFPLDLTVNRMSVFGGGTGSINWAMPNLWKGWYPS